MNLREARESTGLTQLGLALKIGMTVQTLSRIERGNCFPRRETQQLIETALGCEIDWLDTAVRRPYVTNRNTSVGPEDRVIGEIYRYLRNRTTDQDSAFWFLEEFLTRLKALLAEPPKGRTISRSTITRSKNNKP